ncbi:MAG: SulP family inorganic anion transporter [Dehalococcoidia bacterium]
MQALGRPRLDLSMSRRELASNVVAGVLVGVIAFPLAIALAVAVGVSPVAGLYTAAFAGFAASLFGGSRFNITGPTAALVPLLLHVTVRHGVEALPLVGFLAGLMLVAMGVLRFGRLVRFMPGLVVVGFTGGIAVSIAFGQVNALLGLRGTDPRLEYFHEKLADTVRHLGSIEPASAVIGVAAIAFLFLWQSRPRRIPGALLVVVAATAAAQLLNLEVATVSTKYGALPTALPLPTVGWLDPALALELLPTAAAIAVLGAVEALLAAVVADGMSGLPVRHDSDRELIGQGIANLVSPIFHGIPATAAIARTAAGIRNGATSRLSGLVHAVTVLVLTLVFARIAGDIPLAALAAILIVVAYGIADVPELSRLLRSAPREDLVVLVGTLVVTVVLDLTFAIALGIIASTVLLLRRLISVPVANELLADERTRTQDIPESLRDLIRSRPDLLFFHAQGAISFHSAATFESMLSGHDERPLLLRMRDVHHIDSSGLITLQGIIEHRRHAGGRLVLTDVQPGVEPALRRFGIYRMLGEDGVYPTTEAAITAIPARPWASVATAAEID